MHKLKSLQLKNLGMKYLGLNLSDEKCRVEMFCNPFFEEYAMYGATVTMVCEYKVGESEYVDSIKWYKDNREFYRIVPHTSIEKDKVVTFNRSGINLDLQRSGVSTTTTYICDCAFWGIG